MEDARSTRVAAAKFLDAMAPGDRVGIFTTSGQLTQDFTSDKEVLKRKLIGLMPRGMLNKSTTECPNVSFYTRTSLKEKEYPRFPTTGSREFQIFLQETAACMAGIDPFPPEP